jgi:hypothetical protein
MKIFGDLLFAGSGQAKSLRIENLASDPSSPIVGQFWYNTTDGVYRGYDGTTVITFASGGNTALIVTELNSVETSVGLNSDGTFISFSGTNYIDAATSIANGEVLLDSAIKTVADNLATANSTASTLQTEVNAIETSVGLNSNGTYTAPTGTNYLGGATSVANALTLLDTQAFDANTAAAAADDNANTRVLKAGDTMTGNLVMSAATHITLPDAPVNATDAANKSYVDNALSGLYWRNPISTPNLIAQTATPPGSPATGDAYLVASSPTGAWSAITPGTLVEWDGSAWVEAGVMVSGARFGVAFESATTPTGVFAGHETDIAYISGGSAGAFTFTFIDPTDAIAVSDLNPLSFSFGHSYVFYVADAAWTEFQGPAALGAGVGLRWSGNTLHVNLGAGIAQLPTDEVGIDVYASGGLFLTENGSAASGGTAAQLSILLNGSTLDLSSNGLKVASQGITSVELASSVAGGGLTGGNGSALAVGAGTGITVNADDVALDLTYADARYINVTGDTMTGSLTLSGDPTSALHAAPKQYVDALSTRVDGFTFVYNGSSSATTHVVTHNLNFQYCNVTVVDSSDNIIIPDRVTFDTVNQLTIVFSASITCKAVITGVNS